MDADEGFDDEGPFAPWVPPDDRLWRHPSESSGEPTRPLAAVHPPHPFARPTLNSRPWVAILAAGVVGALLASGIGVISGGFVHTTVVRPYLTLSTPVTTVEEASDAQPTPSWSSVYDELAPSMVTVSANTDAGVVTTSGMVWKVDQSGETAYILAADESLSGLGSVTVGLAGSTVKGTVVGVDPETGIAVVSVPQRDVPLLDFPQLASPTDVRVGDSLAAVSPGTSQSSSFASATVGSLYQTVSDTDSGVGMVGMIAVNTGGPVNAGAAVVDSEGSVVGLVVEGTAGTNALQPVAYAIPMALASTVGAELVNGVPPWHPWIGVLQAQDFVASMSGVTGISGGAMVDEISPGSPAAQAGLGPNDVIIGLGNTLINSTGALVAALDQSSFQTRLVLRYLTQNKQVVTTYVTVIAQPSNPSVP